ncbi:Hypothetical protein D9617_2g057570 [Elsinoe fawcettii]|nr:Hypothetical protein D9617_2g057570 [Elsinoe fawcettii]
MSQEDSQPREEIRAEEMEVRPQDQLPPCDWMGLQRKMHEELAEKDAELQKLYEEWSILAEFQSAWIHYGARKENERASKRHKTQQTFVQHQEAEVEANRQRYASVMKAFENAMQMLN